jgi:phage terminase small subunit
MPAKKKREFPQADARKRMFVQSFIKSYNAAQAARDAGYSARTAEVTGSKLLKEVKVQQLIAEAERRIENKTCVSKDKILKELSLCGFSDMADYVTVDTAGCVQIKSIDDLPIGTSRAIKKIKEKRVIKSTQGTKDKPSEDVILESTLEFELHDKLSPLVNMGKELGMFRDKHEVGLDAATAELILSALPSDYAAAVRAKLLAMKEK